MITRTFDYLRALADNRRRHPGQPRFLTYIVTFTCNARCIMCDSWKKPSPNDLSLAEIERVFEQLPQLDAVRLTGGEPFVRKDFADIAALVQKHLKPMFLHVTTNGFLPDRVVDFVENRDRSLPLQLLVSVDGVKEKHNYVRGKDTAWDSVMKTLQSIAPRQKELNVKLMVNQTIVDAEGVEHYKLLRDVLKPMGVRNNMVMAYDASATYSLEEETEVAPDKIGQFFTYGEFTDDHLRELLDEVERDLDDFPFADRMAKRYYLRGIRNRLLREDGEPNPKCVALNAHLRMLPNGDVPTCQFNTKRVGNLRDQTFAEVWSQANERAARQRDWVAKCPGCWAECEVLPSAIYTGDLARELYRPRPSKHMQRTAPKPATATA